MSKTQKLIPSPDSAPVRELKRLAAGAGGAKPLTARAVSELCGVELKTVHNWVAEGRIAHFRTPGRHLRFQAAAVVHFLESCGYQAAPEPTPTALVLAPTPALARALSAQLTGVQATATKDAFEALILAGRLAPKLLVAHGSALIGLNVEQWVRAVAAALPDTRLLLVDYKRPLAAGERVTLKGLRSAL